MSEEEEEEGKKKKKKPFCFLSFIPGYPLVHPLSSCIYAFIYLPKGSVASSRSSTHCVPIMLIEQERSAGGEAGGESGNQGARPGRFKQVYSPGACLETPNRPKDCAHKNFTRSATEKYVNG